MHTLPSLRDNQSFAMVLSNLFDSVQLKSTHDTTTEAFLNDAPQKIICIICDIRLPGMSGLQ